MKRKIDSADRFRVDLITSFAGYESRLRSERIKRALKAKKMKRLSTLTNSSVCKEL